jgi:DedD protein
MEQKKLLLVAISVGVFLVIVIGAAMLALGSGSAASSSAALADASAPRPIPPGEAGSAGGFPPAGEPGYAQETAPLPPVDPAELLKNSGAIPGLSPAPEEAALPQNDFYINGSPGLPPAGESEVPRTVITVTSKSAAGVPDEIPVRKPASRPAQAKPVAEKPAKPPETTAKVYDNYWIQTGSFSAKAGAERVKETLASKGISSIIENREINGKSFFRVRIGPYTGQEEANHWLSFVKSINGFENSQVWKSRPPQ